MNKNQDGFPRVHSPVSPVPSLLGFQTVSVASCKAGKDPASLGLIGTKTQRGCTTQEALSQNQGDTSSSPLPEYVFCQIQGVVCPIKLASLYIQTASLPAIMFKSRPPHGEQNRQVVAKGEGVQKGTDGEVGVRR